MKTTTDNHIDKLLHEAMKQRAAKVPPLADDFAEKVLQRTPLLTSPEGKERKRRVIWPYAASAVAACIVIAFLLWPNSPAVVEQPVIAEVVEQPVQEVPKVSENSEVSEKSEPTEPIKPKRTYKARKVSKPQEEPMLAEAEMTKKVPTENIHQRRIEVSDPYLLAAAQAQDIRSRGERLSQEVALLIEQ